MLQQREFKWIFSIWELLETKTSSQTGSLCVFVDRKERSLSIGWIHREPQSFRLIKRESSAAPTWCSWDRCLPEPSPTEDWWTDRNDEAGHSIRTGIKMGLNWPHLPQPGDMEDTLFCCVVHFFFCGEPANTKSAKRTKRVGRKKATLSLRIKTFARL